MGRGRHGRARVSRIVAKICGELACEQTAVRKHFNKLSVTSLLEKPWIAFSPPALRLQIRTFPFVPFYSWL